MTPRRRARWLPSSATRAAAGPDRQPQSSRLALALFIALCVCVAGAGAGAVQAAAAAVQADTGLRVISGASYRAFTNRFRRHLHGKRDCLSFHEADNWWRYEWCLGRHVRQFHVFASDGSAKPDEWSIVLGRHASDTSKRMRVLPVDDPDKRELISYVAEQVYPQGESCSVGDSALERKVAIQYKCCVFRANETYIEAVTEPSPCQYTMAVCTPAACGLAQKDQYVFGASTHVTEEERLVLVQTVKDMFYHAYHGYMDNAFPLDTLLPLSCRGETFELGKIQLLTLIDTLDTLAILEDAAEFQRAVKLVVEHAEFNLDTEVSVFETTIRVLGGLLSAHLFAVDTKLALFPPTVYKNELLSLAVDLAERLLPAFNTSTGIPYGTVNLRHGVPRGETPIASTAGAGSLSMEFTMLSVLTGDIRYANASRRAVRGLFDRRSRVGLVGKHIDTRTGEWTETVSGPGSNSDSFYEYLWKMYVAFNDMDMLAMFDTVYPAVLACNLHGDWFADVSMWSGCSSTGSSGVVFENLAAFWPGMQATLGHVRPAARSMNAFYKVWRDYGFIPEQFNVATWKPLRGGAASYPLRPELIESTFYLHEATQDPSWLRAGAHFVHSLQKHTKTQCGYATVADVESKQLADAMPSFFLSETCKYLYLLFNTTHFVRTGGYVLTTEAHPFPILPATSVDKVVAPTSDTTPLSRTTTNRQCPVPVFWHALGYQLDYEPLVVDKTEHCARPTSDANGDTTAAKAVDDWLPLLEKNLRAQLERLTDMKDHKEPPTMDGYVAEEDTPAQTTAEEDPQPRPSVQHVQGGSGLGVFRVERGDGLVRVTRQDTGEWLETTGVGDDHARFQVLSWLPERRGFARQEQVSDADDELPLLLPRHRVYDSQGGRTLRRLCHVYVELPGPRPFFFSCVASSFGVAPQPRQAIRFAISPLRLATPLDACGPIVNPSELRGRVAVVARGDCFFETKARHVALAGAIGVVVVNNEEDDRVMVMSGSGQQQDQDGEDAIEGESLAIPAVMVPRRVGEWLQRQSERTDGGVYAEIEITAMDRDEDADEFKSYVGFASEANENEEEEVRRRAMNVYPRLETVAASKALRVYAPSWGLQLTPTRRRHGVDWSLEILAVKPPS